MLALVVNRAAAVGSHADVLTDAAALTEGLRPGLVPLICARWPELAGTS